MRRNLAIALFAVAAVAVAVWATSDQGVQQTLSGSWEMAAFDVGNGPVDVIAGVNTVEPPLLVSDRMTVGGHTGCNSISHPDEARFEYTDGVLTFGEIIIDAGGCEFVVEKVLKDNALWSGQPINVSFENEMMFWQTEEASFTFVRPSS